MILCFRWHSKHVPPGTTLVFGFPGWFLPRLYLYEGQKLIIGNWRAKHLSRLLKAAWARRRKFWDYPTQPSTKAPLPKAGQ